MDDSRILCIMVLVLINIAGVYTAWTFPALSVVEGDLNFPISVDKVTSDKGEGNVYHLTGVGVDKPDFNGIQKFKINNATGLILHINEVDREKLSEYDLTVSLYNKNGVKVEDDVRVVIKVTDSNDVIPTFVKESLNGEVPENYGTSLPFMTVSALDEDDTEERFFGLVWYEIINDSDSPPSASGNRFRIDPETGDVYVVGELDHEKDPTVTFIVKAFDNKGKTPTNHRLETVTVQVTDSNDHAPVFDSLSDKSLSELWAVNTPFYNIYATDEDEGVNKKVYFRITNGNTGGTFDIISVPSDTDRSKGILQLAKPLNYESGNTVYDLEISAYNEEADNGEDPNYTQKTNIRVKVIDENEAPIFQDTPYVTRMDENESADEPVPVLTVIAKDFDFKGNQSVEYSVDDPMNWFQIDKKTGQISRIGIVDREAHVVENGVYDLRVVATDNYRQPANKNGIVSITIGDVNDNPPLPDWTEGESTVVVCQKPVNRTVKVIEPIDPDSAKNGPPFTFRFDSTVNGVGESWGFKKLSEKSQEVVALFNDYELTDGIAKEILPIYIIDSGSPSQTGTTTLTVSICACSSDGEPTCKAASAAGFPVAIIIAIVLALLLIIILVLALVAYRRKQAALVLKEPFFDDEDDVRENVQVYQEEGGEEDQEAYDLSALRAPLLEDPNQPIRIEKPLQQAPRQPRGHVPDDIGDYIGEAKDQADADPSAPPFDSLLVFDYEGMGSDAGSLSSINTATTDGSVDYDYLNNWGPRFKKLADMYNDGSDSE